MPIPLFVSPIPVLRHKRLPVPIFPRITPIATASDKSNDNNNLEFIKDRIDDLRNFISSPSLTSFLSIDDLPSRETLPSLSALQRLVAISTFRALSPTSLDHLCPLPTEPPFDPRLGLYLATYAFRAYHEPPSSAYRETLVTPVADKYTLEVDFVYPSTQQITANATGLFLLKLSNSHGSVSAHINCATVRDIYEIGHVSLLRIRRPGQSLDDVLNLYLYSYTNGKAPVPSHTASLPLKSIVDSAFQTQGQVSHPPVTLTFHPVDYETHRIDYFQETLLPTGLQLPFMSKSNDQVAARNREQDLMVTVEASFLPFTSRLQSDVASHPRVSSREREGRRDLDEEWDVSEAIEALGNAIQEAAEEEEEAEKSLTLGDRGRRDAVAFILHMQLPERTMPAPTDWKRLATAASTLIDRMPTRSGNSKILDVNATPCLFVESQATDTEVWFFRDFEHKSLVVSFRGTEQVSWQDFFTDAQVFLQRWVPGEDVDLTVSMRNTVGLDELVPSVVGKSEQDERMADHESAVHYGFLRAYMSVRDAVDRGISLLTEGKSDYRVLFTGHSLGGALATIAAADLAARRNRQVCCISYGAPKVGNINFAKRFNELVPNAFRVVNDSDLVSRMPRSLSGGRAVDRYKHSGRTVLVNDFGDIWIEGENDEVLARTQSSIANPFKERYKDLKELVEQEKQLWEQLLSGMSVRHHMEDSYFRAMQQVARRVAERLDQHDDDRAI